MSIGLASFPEAVSHAEEVRDRTDEAFDNNKRCGRNRVSEPRIVSAIA
ncbi:MAG: hypothetical protein PVH54_08230 [Gammaproteobacteria bacterium]